MILHGDETAYHDHQLVTNNEESETWLNLSLDTSLVFVSGSTGNSEPQSKPVSSKNFSCNFCRRKFYSSQALGGHQNAHKRERGAVKKYQTQRMMSMIGLPVTTCSNNSMVRSLGFRPHSLVHMPSRDSTVARLNDLSSGPVMAASWTQPLLMEDSMDSMWSGSFRSLDPRDINESPSEAAPPLKLDLNLRL